MGVGNCTEEPVVYDVEPPGSNVSIAFAEGAVGVGLGLAAGALVASSPVLGVVSGIFLLIGGVGIASKLRETQAIATSMTRGIGKRSLGSGQYDHHPGQFTDPSMVRFCHKESGEEIATVQLDSNQGLVTLFSGGVKQPSKAVEIGSPVCAILLRNRCEGEFEVDLLTAGSLADDALAPVSPILTESITVQANDSVQTTA